MVHSSQGGAAANPIRSFTIDGLVDTETTHRTGIIESITPVSGRSFLDVGACDGYESRALAVRGASRVIAVEGKRALWEQASRAAELIGVPTHRAVLGDIRRIDELDLGVFDCVCCFGVLYHMSNPFNLLKRLAHSCSDLLLLETHIAPEPWTERELLSKHRGALLPGVRTLYLDGARFEGRVCIHRGEHDASIGSLDERWTFWLTASSLAKALTRSGFTILQWHHELDAQSPEMIAKRGRDLRFGYANSKIFVVARVEPVRRMPIVAGSVSSDPDRLVQPDMTETVLDRVAFQASRLRRRLGF
jgi:hypothetical protein